METRRWIIGVQLLLLHANRILGLRTYELPFPCNGQTTTIVVEKPQLGYLSSGIVRTASYIGGRNCSIILEPGVGVSGIVVSLKKVDIRPKIGLTCLDSLTIDKTVYCDSFASLREATSYSSNQAITITFKSAGGFTGLHRGFQLTFTAYTDWPCSERFNEFSCDNRRCIFKDLTCDGHNHCGDTSDQLKCGPSVQTIIGYVFGSVFLVIGFMCAIIYFMRRKQRQIVTTTVPTPVIYPGSIQYPYGAIPQQYPSYYPPTYSSGQAYK